jgi:choline dehydrogenase-like flavoprotein
MSDELTRVFVTGGYELGALPRAGETSERVFRGSRSSVYDGRRWSSLESYLRPALGRPNLHVMLNTHVVKVRCA